MELTAVELWNRILEAARPVLPEQSFQTWLSGSSAVGFSEGCLEVEAASPFHQEMIEDRFRPVLEELAERILGAPVHLKLQAAEPDRTVFTTVDLSGPGAERATRPPTPGAAAPAEPRHDTATLNERYTFDRFVVGNNNQLAAAACRAVAEKPARMYNPLFLYGGVGLGKTHLMHAIGNHILANKPSSRIVYVSSEQFMNDLVNSIQMGKTAEFRRRYRAMDLLLVDDVHFLEGKERTQEEFFHTFNALYDAQKQIILTSDRPPKEIPGLEDRLVSRFEWGLVADIKPPDYETRVAILRKKADDDHLSLDDEVIDFIAHACTASVRELEGAVIKLLALSSLQHQEINIAFAKSALSSIVRDPGPEGSRSGLTPQRIKQVVAEEWAVKPEALASKRRTKDLTAPRQVAMYLLKELLDLPLVRIGDLFGGRDHSTVIHSIRKVQGKLEEDPTFQEKVEETRRRLTGT
ncbi:MAG: chromosomal replication initiator protein DnaA [Gemmatimonadales bacterium]|jgi:chromosomal replication initiator protein|nr:MAG: chromosomal replication initiator protein DnaA [Gemmatimonadales bacterium]